MQRSCFPRLMRALARLNGSPLMAAFCNPRRQVYGRAADKAHRYTSKAIKTKSTRRITQDVALLLSSFPKEPLKRAVLPGVASIGKAFPSKILLVRLLRVCNSPDPLSQSHTIYKELHAFITYSWIMCFTSMNPLHAASHHQSEPSRLLEKW